MSEISSYRQRPAQAELASKLKVLAWIVSGLVLGLVMVMRRITIPLPDGVELSFLPPIHALINTLACFALVGALVAIKNGRVEAHRKFITGALALSVLFLLSYVAYHFTTPETIFGETDGVAGLSAEEKAAVGPLRSVYLALLIPHILLAGISLPFILITLIYAVTNQFEKHRRMARWVFPMWLFVAVTGPICYFMLRPYY